MLNRIQLKRVFDGQRKILGPLVVMFISVSTLVAQRQTWQDEAFEYRCRAILSSDANNVAVVVCEFYSHGAIGPETPAVAVYQLGKQTPSRILQTGPGDLCRIAFQTLKGRGDYQIYYGAARATDAVPVWTADAGLLLETRTWVNCNLRQLDSVRKSFATAHTLGSDFVDQVFHRYNPFDVQPAPFLSHYQGTLRVTKSGLYRFFTSSQDCSFLLIDDAVVVSLPGRQQRLIGQAKIKGEVSLEPGGHRFDYWHAASGLETGAVAAWQPPGGKVELIPASAFAADQVVHLSTTTAEQRNKGPLPNFEFAIRGDAPIEQSEQWAVRVQFQTGSVRGPQSGRCEWEFGDGQTSSQWQPTHIYLHPGPYTIKLQLRERGKPHELTNRIWVTRPIQHRGKQTADKLEDYLPIIDTYDPANLDSAAQLQLVRLEIQRQRWDKAVAAGRAALQAEPSKDDDAARWQIINLVGPIARLRLEAPQMALDLWKAAGKTLTRARWRAVCALEAADLLQCELDQSALSRAYLEFAQRELANATGPDAGMLLRLWGDYYARRGDSAKARDAYQKAAASKPNSFDAIHSSAKRGALSRSTEAFLREKNLLRAFETLDQWQRLFPSDKPHGYLSLMLAQYWLAREKPQVAVSVAGDSLTANPRSPYADQLIMLQAAAEQKMGNRQCGVAAYQSLVTDYPGSPLVNEARRQLAELEKEK